MAERSIGANVKASMASLGAVALNGLRKSKYEEE